MAKKKTYGVMGAAALSALFVTAGIRAQGPAPDFVPDVVFSGSQLTGWDRVGAAEWRAENGVIVGTAAPGSAGGWLVFNTAYQDLGFFSRFRCAGPCNTGVLVRAEKTANGLSGIFLSLADQDTDAYKVTIDATGRIVTRELLAPAGTITVRVAQAPGGGRGGRGGAAPTKGGPPPAAPAGNPRWANVKLAELLAPSSGYRANDWNELNVVLDANVLRSTLNRISAPEARNTGDGSMGYGTVALYVGGASEVQFRDLAIKDYHVRNTPAERTGERYRAQRIEDFYYAWGVAVADFNRDGQNDVVSGPSYYLGPTFETKHEIYIASTYSPGVQYGPNMVTYAHDFTGDGWPDVLATESRAMVLYVNPKGEHRRWARYPVIPDVNSEVTLMKDMDGDGFPEIVYSVQGAMAFAKADRSNPTAPWAVRVVSGPNIGFNHGVGAGDVNGDGRLDVLGPAGWWEQPATDAPGPWPYHAQAFGRWGPGGAGPGGGEIAVYDVNGDTLNDVVTTLDAHDFGLAWYEQKRSASGEISFVRHMIMDNFSTKNAGGVTFSELHAAHAADMDGDGIPDFVTGKRHWAHLDAYGAPDPYGAAVLYVFKTVRNPKAPGGAEFVPELVHNRSGVGSQFTLTDVNKDGTTDIVTATNRGTFVFLTNKGQ